MERVAPPAGTDGGGRDTTEDSVTLSEAFKAEIHEAFRVFDEERSGRIGIHSLKILLRALGFRVTRRDVAFELERLGLRRRGGGAGGESSPPLHDHDDDAAVIDVDAVCAIVARKLARRDSAVEMKTNFRLFTDTDYITEENLRRVARELGDEAGAGGIRDETLKAMIEVFDSDLDGKISFAEFRRIMAPSE